jgi:predicted TIM-barrel fold metal-dependent hydrolase
VSRPQFTDTHVHFYDLRRGDLTYDWLRPGGDAAEAAVLGDYSAIRAERYWGDDFLRETRFAGVGHVVHVQAAVGSADPVAETGWLADLKARTGTPDVAVVYIDLAANSAADILARHLEFGFVRGVRDLRYDDYLTNPRWHRGFGMLARNQLVCCDAPAVTDVAAVTALLRAHPDVTYCLDHAMMPRARTPEYFAQWNDALGRLAQLPNTVIKISGLGQVDHEWTVESLRPWVLACIETFGTERSFFGTNWPVDRLYSSYGDLLDAYNQIVSDFSETERVQLFSGSADRIFRIQ